MHPPTGDLGKADLAVADLAVRKPAVVNKTPLAFEPLAPGCSRKIDVPLDPGKRSNTVKFAVTGSVDGRLRRDADNFKYR